MTHGRVIDGGTKPTDRAILETIGKRADLWSELREYLVRNYDHVPTIGFDGVNYGWSIRYRKGGKTLVTLYPERGSFTALVVLGKDETAKAEAASDKLSKKVRDLLLSAELRRDGKWLWIRPTARADIRSIAMLLSCKRRPKRTSG